ncbi:MAG TPA: hypothetical protein VJR30_22030 [Bradyrhizobium sp.]|nr:hypothetical protein [Bradyrhizobium sp.]
MIDNHSPRSVITGGEWTCDRDCAAGNLFARQVFPDPELCAPAVDGFGAETIFSADVRFPPKVLHPPDRWFDKEAQE